VPVWHKAFLRLNEHKVDSALTVDEAFRRQALRLTITSYGTHTGPDFAHHGSVFSSLLQ
jgi:hypothetical protein